MKVKYLFATAMLAVVAALGLQSSEANDDKSGAQGLSDAPNSPLDDVRVANSCEASFDTDYMEVLESDNDDVLFSGCGGLL